MNCDVYAPKAGLAAASHFNQGSANTDNSTDTILIDASGDNHSGVLNNFALPGASSNWVASGDVVTGRSAAIVLLTMGPETR